MVFSDPPYNVPIEGHVSGLGAIHHLSLIHISEPTRQAEISTWDDRLLAEILEELAALDLDFNIEATGFSMGEIDLRIESL